MQAAALAFIPVLLPSSPTPPQALPRATRQILNMRINLAGSLIVCKSIFEALVWIMNHRKFIHSLHPVRFLADAIKA
jgi:hypothetical protein